MYETNETSLLPKSHTISLFGWNVSFTCIARPCEAGSTSPQLKYLHYLHRANTHLKPASHYSHRIIIQLEIFEILNNAKITNTSNNVSKYLHCSHQNMQIMRVITYNARITCNTRITCIEHPNNASSYLHHYSHRLNLTCIILTLHNTRLALSYARPRKVFFYSRSFLVKHEIQGTTVLTNSSLRPLL